MIRDLPATVTLDNRDRAGIEDMRGLPGLPLGKHGRVLEEPDFIRGIRRARVDVRAHTRERDRVVDQGEFADDDVHNTISIRSCPLSSRYSASSCS